MIWAAAATAYVVAAICESLTGDVPSERKAVNVPTGDRCISSHRFSPIQA